MLSALGLKERILPQSSPGSVWYPHPSLSGDHGTIVVHRYKKFLVENKIIDVDVKIRESVVTRSAGPKLLTSHRLFRPHLISIMSTTTIDCCSIEGRETHNPFCFPQVK